MKLEVLTRPEDIAAIRSRWEELVTQDRRDGFFRTPAWYEAWMRHIRPDAEPFIVIGRDSGGVISALAPFCRLTYRDLGLQITALSFAGREVVSGDFLDFVAENAVKAEFVSSLVPYLAEFQSKWGLLVAGELIEDGESHRILQKCAAGSGLGVRTQEERQCPYIALPHTFDEYLGSLSSSTRYHIRRRTRDLLEKSEAEIQVYSAPRDICERLDILLRLHVARWQRDGEPGTLGRPGFLEFLRDVCGNPPSYASSRLYVLSHQGSPVAALLMFYFGDSALYYQAGWDPESAVSAHSPGVVLMARTVRDAIEDGYRYYDFLRGDEGYKSRWASTQRTTVTLLCGRSLMARQYLRLCELKDGVKHHLLRT